MALGCCRGQLGKAYYAKYLNKYIGYKFDLDQSHRADFDI